VSINGLLLRLKKTPTNEVKTAANLRSCGSRKFMQISLGELKSAFENVNGNLLLMSGHRNAFAHNPIVERLLWDTYLQKVKAKEGNQGWR
jgi:hypothetical protein